MASEIRVDKINSLSGVGTVTLSPTGVDISGITTVQTLKVGTGVTASEDGDIFFTGVCTATTFTGSGANLTNLPAANVTGTLPAISGANLTSLTAGNLTGALPAISGANLTGIGGTDFIHAEQVNVSGIVTATAFVPSQGQLSNRNVIINGDFQISQRGTSITTANAYLCDRWKFQSGGLDENCTQEQVDVASGTSPYGLGFRKAWKITNGNQTSGAGAADYIELYQYIEGHNMATCGWDYKNPNSKMTLSFWIKSSVAQKFPGFLYTTLANGTSVGYMYDYSIDNGGSNLTADTWTKITHTFPGNSNLNITNGSNYGLGFGIYPFSGTNLTTSRSPSNAWQVWSTSNKTPDVTSTWYTTNNATLEITGVQLEVGSAATPFEHRSFGDELIRCQRYFQSYPHDDTTTAEGLRLNGDYSSVFQTPMRTVPTGTVFGVSGTAGGNSGKYDKDAVGNQNAAIETKHSGFEIDTDGGAGLAAVTLDAEL